MATGALLVPRGRSSQNNRIFLRSPFLRHSTSGCILQSTPMFSHCSGNWNLDWPTAFCMGRRHSALSPNKSITQMEPALARSRVMVLDLSGRRILVVEDEPLIAMEIAQTLESARASVFVAATLDEALRLTEQGGLSAAVLDLVLGASDGGALCARLRERAIPFVIYSGRTDIPVGCEPGAFVSKPAHPEALLQAIASVLVPHC